MVGALTIGVDYDTFWHLTPAKLDIFVLWKFMDESELTEEEREKREMDAEIAKMKQWIANDQARGLPETKVI